MEAVENSNNADEMSNDQKENLPAEFTDNFTVLHLNTTTNEEDS
jgi:hypothetical protein